MYVFAVPATFDHPSTFGGAVLLPVLVSLPKKPYVYHEKHLVSPNPEQVPIYE